MSRLADALERAGSRITVSAFEADEWVTFPGTTIRESSGAASTELPRLVRETATAARQARVRVNSGTAAAYDLIARFAVEQCEARGNRVVLFTSVHPTTISGGIVLGAAAAAARRRAAPVVVVDAQRTSPDGEGEMRARDAGDGVWVVPAVAGTGAERRRLFAALAHEFGLVFVHGPDATSDAAEALAAETAATLLLVPASGDGLAAAVGRLGRRCISGVVAIGGDS